MPPTSEYFSALTSELQVQFSTLLLLIMHNVNVHHLACVIMIADSLWCSFMIISLVDGCYSCVLRSLIDTNLLFEMMQALLV